MTKEINKKINVNGQQKVVRFRNVWVERTYESKDEKRNKVKFIIDGVKYQLECIAKRKKEKMNKVYIYDGISFPDNEKKIIEYILSKGSKK